MTQQVHTLYFDLSMRLLRDLEKVNRFDASWLAIEKREGQNLKQLKALATVRSTGSSTRIEGSKMTDVEVEHLLDNLKTSTLDDRDAQEVAGYFLTLDTVTNDHPNIDISQGNIKNLHNVLMQHSSKDAWHRGDFKKVSNAVEATYADGSKRIVFRTSEPGFETDDAMRSLFDWYAKDNDTIALIKIAVFIYEFLSIHPFQDGNGRLSRLLGTLLLLKHGYNWIQYVSFEHEIENRKDEYYKVLMQTQQQRPGENINEWLLFFLDCLITIQAQLMGKLTRYEITAQLGLKEKNILTTIENYPGLQSSEVAQKLGYALPTVKKIVATLVEQNLLIKSGIGAGTHYFTQVQMPVKKNLMFTLNQHSKQHSFVLRNERSWIEFKKIILVPQFNWINPKEWKGKIMDAGLGFKISLYSANGKQFSDQYSFLAYAGNFKYDPVFDLLPGIDVPLTVRQTIPFLDEFPIQCTVELISTTPDFPFESMFIYDAVLH